MTSIDDMGSASGPSDAQERVDAMRRAIEQAHHGARAALVMGIVNVTPDSFSDGGKTHDAEMASDVAVAMMQEGAALVDVGGESTRPGATRVLQETESARVVPVVRAAANLGVPLSCDTYKAEVARRALAAGAIMVNDVGGLSVDPLMARVVADAGALITVMHGLNVALSHDANMTRVLIEFFGQAIARAELEGVPRTHIVLDPGIGFNKTDAQNIACFHAIPALRREFDLPVLIGVSRKSLLGRLLTRDVEARLAGSLSAAVMAASNGAAILRVHDVAPHFDAMKIAFALRSQC